MTAILPISGAATLQPTRLLSRTPFLAASRYAKKARPPGLFIFMFAILHGDHPEHRIISGFSGGCGKSLLWCGDLADAYAVERGAALHAGGLGAAVRVGLAGQRRHDAAVLRGAYLVRIAIAGETVTAVGVGCA